MQVLAGAEAHNRELGHYNFGSLSADAGFVPAQPPVRALPDTHRAWDAAVERLPELYRRDEVRKALDALPVLSASSTTLPDTALLRAATVLGVLGHAYAHETSMPAPAPKLPLCIAAPWLEVHRRLHRADALTLTYADLIVNNWRLAEPPDGIRLSTGQHALLVPSINNREEQIFYLAQLEVLILTAPVVAAAGRAIDAARDHDGPVVREALDIIDQALLAATRRALTLIDPRPTSLTYVDPVVWAKTVAPFAVPLQPGGLGPSGTASPVINLLDAFFGRTDYNTTLGREILAHRRSYPLHWQQFIDCVAETPITSQLRSLQDPRLRGQLDAVQQHYTGPGGFLDRHRKRVYGYLSLAFRVGRSVTIGGFAGPPQNRTWDEVNQALLASQSERPSRDISPVRGTHGRPMRGKAETSRQITVRELALHNGAGNGFWIAIHDRVYDVTQFLSKHPGGPHVLQAYAGLDATGAFDAAHTGTAARNVLHRLDVGLLRHPWAPTGSYMAWMQAVYAVVETQNNFRLDRLPLESRSTPETPLTGVSQLQRRFASDTLRRYRDHYLPSLYEGLHALLRTQDALLPLPTYDQQDMATGLDAIEEAVAALKAHLLRHQPQAAQPAQHLQVERQMWNPTTVTSRP